MTLLQRMTSERARAHEKLRLETRLRLRDALRAIAPAEEVIVFGSLVKPGRFTENSDVDLALQTAPSATTIYQLSSLLAERMERSVDIVILPECRFAERIAREGETWTNPD